MKYKGYLKRKHYIGEQILFATNGTFKIRKNGKHTIVVDRGNKNEEVLRVTLLKD